MEVGWGKIPGKLQSACWKIVLRGSCPKPTVATQAVQTLGARTSFKRSNLRDTGMEHLALLAGRRRKSRGYKP